MRSTFVGWFMSDLLIIGSGLIGTSIGLALRAVGGWDVTLADIDRDRVARAGDRGAGRRWDGQEPAAVVLVAAPTFATATVLVDAQRRNLGVSYTHVSSVQVGVQAEVERLGGQPSSLVGGHPMGGNERSGPEAADAGMFAGRPWVLCPSRSSSAVSKQAVRSLAKACGGIPVEMTSRAHDVSVALVSHLPQVTASVLAGALLGAEASATALAGPGLADTTRIAASQPDLWVDVLSANAARVAPLLHALAGELMAVARALDELAGPDASSHPSALAVVRAALERGQAGRALIPIKRGVLEERFARVPVAVPDLPGQLAGLLVAAAGAGVNVEDVRVEHIPGRPRGVIELLVHRDASSVLATALGTQGWDVLPAP